MTSSGQRYDVVCHELASDAAENLGRFLVRSVQAMDFEFIPTVKRKLDVPYKDHLVVNFRRFAIIAELSQPEVARREIFLENAFLNDPLR